MNAEKLVTMANQIASFYEAMPSEDEAEKGIASHIKKFWNSVMVNSIIAHVKDSGGKGLHPRVLSAINNHIV